MLKSTLDHINKMESGVLWNPLEEGKVIALEVFADAKNTKFILKNDINLDLKEEHSKLLNLFILYPIVLKNIMKIVYSDIYKKNEKMSSHTYIYLSLVDFKKGDVLLLEDELDYNTNNGRFIDEIIDSNGFDIKREKEIILQEKMIAIQKSFTWMDTVTGWRYISGFSAMTSEGQCAWLLMDSNLLKEGL